MDKHKAAGILADIVRHHMHPMFLCAITDEPPVTQRELDKIIYAIESSEMVASPRNVSVERIGPITDETLNACVQALAAYVQSESR